MGRWTPRTAYDFACPADTHKVDHSYCVVPQYSGYIPDSRNSRHVSYSKLLFRASTSRGLVYVIFPLPSGVQQQQEQQPQPQYSSFKKYILYHNMPTASSGEADAPRDFNESVASTYVIQRTATRHSSCDSSTSPKSHAYALSERTLYT